MKGWLAHREHAVVLVLVFAASLMLPHLGGAFGGYHGFNEAFYTDLGASVMRDPLSYPTRAEAAVDYNIPPLLAYLLGLSFSLLGVAEASARLVPVAFSMLSVILVYLLGRRLYNMETGLAASAVLAVTPMHVLVGRNVQTDTLFVALGLTGLYLYVCDRHVPAGLALGLSFLAKQPAVLFLAGIMLLELAGKRRVKEASYTTLVFIATISPYILYNLAYNPGRFLAGQASRLLLTASAEGGRHGLGMVAAESFWGLSPLLATAFTASLAYMLKRRRDSDNFIVLFSLLSIAFFIFYNKHSYYILPLAPFAALAVGRGLSTVRDRGLMLAVTLVLLASGAFYSTLMLAANKYGYEEYRRLPSLYSEADAVLLVSETVSGSYLELIRYYNPKAELVELAGYDVEEGHAIPLDYSRPTYSLIHHTEVDLKSLSDEHRLLLFSHSAGSDKYALVLFGVAFYEAFPENPHFFTNTPLRVKTGLPPTTFGVIGLWSMPGLYLVKLKPQEKVYARAGGGYSIRQSN